MKLTDSDMLTEVVKRGVDNKYSCSDLPFIDFALSARYEPNVRVRFVYLSQPFLKKKIVIKSLPDLLADHEFMKAVYGDKCYKQASNHPVDGCCFFFICAKEPVEQQNKKSCHVPVWRYYSIEAFKMIQDGDNAIKYLYDSLPEESCE